MDIAEENAEPNGMVTFPVRTEHNKKQEGFYDEPSDDKENNAASCKDNTRFDIVSNDSFKKENKPCISKDITHQATSINSDEIQKFNSSFDGVLDIECCSQAAENTSINSSHCLKDAQMAHLKIPNLVQAEVDNSFIPDMNVMKVGIQCAIEDDDSNNLFHLDDVSETINVLISEVSLSSAKILNIGVCNPSTSVYSDFSTCINKEVVEINNGTSTEAVADFLTSPLLETAATDIPPELTVSQYEIPIIPELPLSSADDVLTSLTNALNQTDIICEDSNFRSNFVVNTELENAFEKENQLLCNKLDVGSSSLLPCVNSMQNMIAADRRNSDTIQLSVANTENLCTKTDESDTCTDCCQLHEVMIPSLDPDDTSNLDCLAALAQDVKPGIDSHSDGQIMVYSYDVTLDLPVEAGCVDDAKNERPSVDYPGRPSEIIPELHHDEAILIPESTEAGVKVDGPSKGDDSLLSHVTSGYNGKRRLSTRKLKKFPSHGSLLCKKSTEVALLVEEYLKDTFLPFDSVKPQLVRQSRDILLCRYQGNFHTFQQRFLLPASTLLKSIKSKFSDPICLCGIFKANPQITSKTTDKVEHKLPEEKKDICQNCIGWPLCFNRRLVVHLGELDEALLKPGDFYFCIQESSKKTTDCDEGVSYPSTCAFESICGTLEARSALPATFQENSSISHPASIISDDDCHQPASSSNSISADNLPLVISDSASSPTATKPRTDAAVFLSIKCKPKPRQGSGSSSQEVLEHRIDENDLENLFATMDWTESTEVMINDDQLTNVLQHLLLSVERGIERLEWSAITKQWSNFTGQSSPSPRCCYGITANTKDSSVQTNPEEELPLAEANTETEDGTTGITGGQSASCAKDVDGQEKAQGEDLLKEIENCSVSTTNLDDGRMVSKEASLTEEITHRLSSNSLRNAEEDPDDGYYEHTLIQPSSLNQVDADLLHSQIAILPGCRCLSDRSVVVICSLAVKEYPSISACQLAQLLLYYHTIPKKEVISCGFLVLVDAWEASEEFWNVLDEAFYLLEGHVANAVGKVLVLLDETQDTTSLFSTSRIQFEVVDSKEKLLDHIDKGQLLTKYTGAYSYDHQEWISFRKFLEPFIQGCRLSGSHLINLLEELRSSRIPPSSALTLQMIEQQKKCFRQTFQDEQLRHLEEEGDTILQELESYRTKSPQNADYSDNLDRTTILYAELRKAMTKLSRLAEKRMQRLEQCLQMRTFQEESSQVLSWLCRKGAESLQKHQTVADSLAAIKDQEEDFEKFYFLAMRQIERGNDLLEEVSMLTHEPSLPKIREESQTNSDDDSGVQELAVSLKQHLGSFSEKLEGARERIEDTAKCYQLMDKSYEWALEAMKFVSQMGVSNTGNAGDILQQIRSLQEYLDDNVTVSDETFQEILDLSEKLSNEKLTQQCKVTKSRCQETIDLIHARLKTLHKVKQQMEVDSFRGPLWDGEESVPVPRTTRSHSQPMAVWNPSSSTPYAMCHHRRRSDSNALSSVPQNFGSPLGSYTSFPTSYYPTVKDTHPLDSFLQDKEEQLLQRGLITEDLTCQGPVTSISKGVLDSRISQRDSSISSASSSSNKNVTSVLRSSGRGTYCSSSSGGANIRWSNRHTKRLQSWQLRDEALERIKNEVREQNDILRSERLHSTRADSEDSLHSSEADLSPSSESSCKTSLSDPVKGPVPVNTHLLSPSLSDAPDIGGSGNDATSDADSKARKTLMLIMNEMIQTERDYVKSLEYIIENYIPELLREDIPQALRGQRNVVFGNIEKIFEFHSQYFLSELEQYENAPFFAGQCFLKYEPQFYLYALYNKNKPKCDTLMIEYGNAFFRKKQLELTDKMDLASYLLKPVQRMGKYALLLKQLLKECPEREPEHQDLKAAEEMVRFQLRHGNDLLAMDALRDSDVNVKEQGRLLRQDEFLVWQGRCRKSLRHVFLFEDLIIFSKARRDPQKKGYEMYQYKHSIKTTDMGLTEQIGDSPSKFEIWFRKRKLNDTYVLQAPTPDVKAAWVHEVSKLLWKQALRNREMRLAEMSSMGIGNKPCLDIKPSEDQINDRSISIHQLARAPRFRTSFGMPPYDKTTNKRPHSIISVSSSSSSGSSQSSFTFYGTLNLGFEPGDSPRPLHRSLTQQSQCSNESGFYTDASTAGDSLADSDAPRHKKAERSDSLLSSDSISTSTTPSELNYSPCEEHIIEESITTSM